MTFKQLNEAKIILKNMKSHLEIFDPEHRTNAAIVVKSWTKWIDQEQAKRDY